MSESFPSGVIQKLSKALSELQVSRFYREILERQEPVVGRYQQMFSAEHLPQMTAEEFKGFLRFRNNHHWTGLQRHNAQVCSDMGKLRASLAMLLDESRPVERRLEEIIDRVAGIGKNTATAILLVNWPDRYGVWNNRSERVMNRLGVWPDLNRSESLGKRYLKINQMLLDIKGSLGTDLWTLDALWWYLEKANPSRQ